MSIVSLMKITLYGTVREKQQLLEEMQSMGCLHIIPLTEPEILEKKMGSSQAQEALKYLEDSPQTLRQIGDLSSLHPEELEQRVIQNKRKKEKLEQEKDSLIRQIKELEPWGHFVLPDPQELAGNKLWFYIVPLSAVKNIRTENVTAHQVNKDNRFSYIVVISENEPEGMAGTKIMLSKDPLLELEKRLDQVEFELEDIQTERINLTRWTNLFKENLYTLEDKATRNKVSSFTYDHEALFALQAWIPSSEIERVKKLAKEKNYAFIIESPAAEEIPPTLLHNKELVKGGEDLLNFYITPNYWLWDPSTTIFFSFAVFFAMIFADAGYAILLGAILAFFWKRMGKSVTGKRFRIVLLALTIFSVIWGILVGSYFGMNPPAQSYLSSLKIIDMNNYSAMMTLSIIVGVSHLILANASLAWSIRHSPMAIANIGWILALVGGLLAFIGSQISTIHFPLSKLGFCFVGLGLLAVVLFTSVEKPAWKRILMGFVGLTRVSGMFGDVLSYLRLFALGLASASLAAVFNNMAHHAYTALPGFKILFALLILLIGHAMNFALSLMSGFIHGLRLNFIEFFNWGLPSEGSPFKAFSKKGKSTWNQ